MCLVSSTWPDRLFVILILKAAFQVLREEFFCRCIEFEPVLWLGEAMSLVGEEHILVIYAFAFHRCNDLFSLGLFHTMIIVSLLIQHGYLNLVNLEDVK